MDSFEQRIAELHSFFSASGKVNIVVHTRPDGDALGCSSAMYHYLSGKMGKDVAVLVPDGYADNLTFITEGVRIIDAALDRDAASARIAEADLTVCMDMNGFGRADGMTDALIASDSRKVLMDHHLNPCMDQFDLVFSETQTSSASELAYWILVAMPEIGDASALPAAAALALMAGMTADTNNFANSVFPSTLTMASELLSAGVDRDAVIAHLYNEFRENRVRAMGYALGENLVITDSGVAYIVIDADKWAELGLRSGETEGFVNIPLSIGHVKASLFLREDGGVFRVSIRSKRGYSAARLAMDHFNGGGHECAAGGSLTIGKDVSDARSAADYIEKVTARFMQEYGPESNKI